MKKTVCFVVREFPILSQTFVIQQINSFINEGHEVTIASHYIGAEDLWDTKLLKEHNLRDKTFFLLPESHRALGKLSRLILIISGFFRLIFTNYSAAMYVLQNCKRIIEAGGLPLLSELISIAKQKNKIVKADAVVAHFGEIGVFACLLSKMNMITSNIFTVFHGYEISEYSTFERWKHSYRWLADHSTMLLPISQLWAKKLSQLGIPNNKITVVHMGIDLNKFKFNPVNSLSTPLKILSVARAVEKKGLEFSIAGAALCTKHIEYNIIGDGPLLESLKSQVAKYDNKERFIFHGSKPSEFVSSMLAKCDLFILTSVTSENGDMEGIPVSLMEAMAAGVIVLSTFHSGIPELIDNNQNGFLVPEKDANAIAAKIDEITTITDIQKIKKAAFTKVSEEFNQVLLSKKMIKLLENSWR